MIKQQTNEFIINEGMGFDIVGKHFYHMHKNDDFVVRDVLMDGGSFMVTTMDGRTIDGTTFQNYIQSDKPLHREDFQRPENNIETGDRLEKDLGSLYEPIPTLSSTPTNQQSLKIKDYDIIDRALSNIKQPDIISRVDWDVYPKSEIDALTKIMGVSEESIVEYIIDKYFDYDNCVEKIKVSMKEYINNPI